jgi:hypothetical protein|tara:strand:- start:30070 stop:33738 length:3669 start_codon:yes stop_codon:yes gene_type:complete
MIRKSVRQFFLLCVLVVSFLGGEALAAAPVTVTAVDKDGIGRLVFNWESAPEFSAEVEDGYLYIRFTAPFDTDLTAASNALENYVGSGEILEGQQSVRFPLKGDITFASQKKGTAVILEMRKTAALQSGTSSGDAVAVRLRAGDHADFSRIVFDWPSANVGYSSRTAGDKLMITFDGLAKINLGVLNNDPLAFAKAATLTTSNGKTQVTVDLPINSSANSFRNEKSIVFDIRKGKEIAASAPKEPEPAPVKTAEVKPAKPAAAPKVEKEIAKPVEKKPEILSEEVVEEKTTTSANAMTLNKPKAQPQPVIERAPEKEVAVVTPLPEPAPIDTRTTEIAAPQPVKNTGVVMASAQIDAQPKTFTSLASGSAIAPIGPTVVLDPPAEEKPVVSEPPKEEAAVRPEMTSEPKAIEVAPVVVKPAEAPLKSKLEIEIANLKDGFRLIFPWKTPAAMAMFESGGAHWVVFDQPIEVDFRNLSGPYKFLVTSARQMEEDTATLLRFNFREGYEPIVNKANDEWQVDFQLDTQSSVKHPLSIQTQGISASEFRAFIPAVDNGREIRFTDPTSGDDLVAMPLNAAGWGIPSARVFNSITILPSLQGIALKSTAADIRIGQEQNGLAITAISNEFAAAKNEPREVSKKPGEEIYPTPEIEMAQFVKLAEWRQVNPLLFNIRKQELQKAAAIAPKKEKRDANMSLAKYFIGHKYYAEALGVLAELNRHYPKIEKDREYRLLNGLAELGMHRYDAAAINLYHDDFEGDVEVAPWRGAVSVGLGNWERAAQELNYSAPAFDVFEKEWADHFRLLRARVALENVDVNLGKQVLEQVKAPKLKAQKAEKAYLEGVLAFQISDFPTASAKFADAIKAGYRPITEKARFDKINVELVAKLINPEQAIGELEKLDFAWRGDELEVDVQKRLGDLYVATGQIGNGLETYKRIVRHFPDSPYSRDLGRKMNELFTDLFLDGGADELPPIKALAIYYQYRELTPVGDRGDQMIQILADRLTRVDLLEQAAQLLEHQVNFRLKGLEKANAGTKLAVVHLWNNKPEEALRVLYDTRWRQLSPEAKKERLHIEARAQAGLQHYKEALAIIASDRSLEADELRAEIYWKSKNWAAAIPAIEKLIGNGGSTTQTDFERLDRQRIMQLAVARNLSDDKAGIQRMRAKYRDRMVETPDQAAFDLITEQNDPSETDFRQRATVIAQVGQLESFMTGYREKLENGQFWATY